MFDPSASREVSGDVPEEVAGAQDSSAQSPDPIEPSRTARILRGVTVSPGLVLGHVHLKDYDLSRARSERVPLDGVDVELNRFHLALDDSREQLADLKGRLSGKIQSDDARILDTHVTYLKDSVFIADVENLILNEQMRLATAIGKVISDFDRIFRLVRNETLRQSAVDLRDVGIRVLRNLESRAASEGGREPPPQEYVLAARELSIVDMFNLANERVQGIITEEGSMTSHAAIFARSMRIPTLTGVEGLLTTIQEGDFVILDATDGCVRVNPDDVLRQQYASSAAADHEVADADLPQWAHGAVATHDGEPLELTGACGNLPEVEQAAATGVEEIGLYRTELLYLVDRDPPSRDALVHHYSAVVAAAPQGRVTFRLLNADAGLELRYLHPGPETNPHLGRAGIRALFGAEAVLRRQLQAILVAMEEAEPRIAVPFVTDCGELRRLKEVLFEERFELKKGGQRLSERVALGAVLETPAALLGVRDIARECDFLMVNLDSLTQHLLAADRENTEVADRFEGLHPMVLRALFKVVSVARQEGRELGIFGVTAAEEANLALLLGAGLRRFALAPGEYGGARRALGASDTATAASRARRQAAGACVADMRSTVVGYRHGYAPPG